MPKRKNQDPREIKKQADMLLVVTRRLEKYMDSHLGFKGKKIEGRALRMVKRGIEDFFDYYNYLQNETTNSAERAKLNQVHKHAEMLLNYFQEPASIPIEYLDTGGAVFIEYLEGNPALLHQIVRDDLEVWLEPLPVILEDFDRKQGKPAERLDLFNLNHILRRIQVWSMDVEKRLAFAGKPKAGAAIGRPRRCLIKSLMNAWELATGLPVRDAYHGSNDHQGYKGILHSITYACLVVAGHRPQSKKALGEEMDEVRRVREKKGLNLTRL